LLYSSFLPEIDFSIVDDFLIFSSGQSSVTSILAGIKNQEIKRLSQSENYSQAATHFYPANYSTAYMNMLGIFNVFSYFKKESDRSLDDEYAKLCQAPKGGNSAPFYDSSFCSPEEKEKNRQKKDEQLFALGAILRVVNVVGLANSLGEQSDKSVSFIHLKELPVEEKERAEQALEGIIKNSLAARETAYSAAFKSQAISMQASLLLACDERQIISDDFKEGAEYFDSQKAFASLKQSCGVGGSGEIGRAHV
jgi:hypothetical protein